MKHQLRAPNQQLVPTSSVRYDEQGTPLLWQYINVMWLFSSTGIVFQTCHSDMDLVLLQLPQINKMTSATPNQVNLPQPTELVNTLLADLPLFPSLFFPVSPGGFDSSWPTFFNHSFTLQLLHCNLCFSSWQIMLQSHFTFSLHSIQVKKNDSSIQHGCNLLPEAKELTSQRCTSLNPPRAKLGNYLSIMLYTSKIQASASTLFCSRKLPLDLFQVLSKVYNPILYAFFAIYHCQTSTTPSHLDARHHERYSQDLLSTRAGVSGVVFARTASAALINIL